MSFEDILIDAIDEELSSLGKNCEKIVYYYLKTEYNINKKEIPCKIKDFSCAIESMFKEGAKILKIRIMENLFRKMGCINQDFYNGETLDFVEYMAATKATIHHKMGIEKVLVSLP